MEIHIDIFIEQNRIFWHVICDLSDKFKINKKG